MGPGLVEMNLKKFFREEARPERVCETVVSERGQNPRGFMQSETVEQTITRLLVGDLRLDKDEYKDWPGSKTVSNVLPWLIGHQPGCLPLTLLVDNIKQAAHEEESLVAVSAAASMVASTAFRFPGEFFGRPTLLGEQKLRPHFLSLLEGSGRNLAQVALSVLVLQPSAGLPDEWVIWGKWCWGVTMGLLQALRWVYPGAPPIECEGDLRQVQEENIIPFLLGVITGFGIEAAGGRVVQAMPSSLDARLSAAILDLAKRRENVFDLLVRQINKQRPAAGFSGPGLAKQVWDELRNRFWHSRSLEQQEVMIKALES